MARKIAPTPGVILDAVERHGWLGHDSVALPKARRELRALLAVAREAKRSMHLHKHYGDGGCHEPEADALRVALARLDKVSKEGK